eukprot:gene7035-biopygen16838
MDAAYDVLRVRYSNMSTRRNFLTAILAFLRYTPSLRDDPRAASARARWTEFHGHARAFQESRYKQHMPSERQLEKYVGLDQIDSKYQELKGGDVTNTTLQDSLDILLLSFVLSMPPKRADMGALRIYEDTDHYETTTRTRTTTRKLPDLLDSLRHWPRDYVFVTRRGHNRPFASNNAYGRWVQSVFSCLFGRATGVTMLRHIFITEKVDPGSMNDDELEDKARQMLHSTDLQRKYNWDRAKICETLSQMFEQCTGGYQFTNSAVGDLLIHGINGGSSQKILVGTQSNNYALVSFEQTEVTVRDAKLSMMNDSGGVQLSAQGDVMYTTGSIIPASTCNVTFGSDASRWESMYVNNLTMSGKALPGSNVSMSNATGNANIWSSGTYLGVNTPNPTQELDLNGSFNVSSNVTIRETLDVGLSTTLQDTLLVNGAATLSNSLTVDGATTLDNTLLVTGAATLSNSLTVDGVTTLDNTLLVTGAATLSNSLIVGGSATLANTLLVTGASTLSNSLIVDGATTLDNTLMVTGAATLSNSLTVDGATILDDTLLVMGASTFSNEVSFANSSTFLSNVIVLGQLSVDTVTYNVSNIVVFASEELRSNLLVEGVLDVLSNVFLGGKTLIGDDLTVDSNVFIQGVTTLSNDLIVTGNTFFLGSGGAQTFEGAVIIKDTLDVYSNLVAKSGLQVDGVASFSNDVYVSSNFAVQGVTTFGDALEVTGASTLSNTLIVDEATILDNTLFVTGASTLSNSVDVYGPASLRNDLFVAGASTLSNTLTVDGATILDNSLFVTGASTLSNTLIVDGATILDNTLFVTGESTLSNSVDVYGPASLRNDLLVMGTSTLSNTLTVDGATIIDNSLFVTGASTLSNSLTVSGAATVDNSLLVIGASTLSNTLTVDGATILDNSMLVTGASTLSNSLTVDGATILDNTLLVTGKSTLSNSVDVYGPASLQNDLLVMGTSTLSNTLTVDGATILDNSLFVTGASTLSNTLIVDGATILDSTLFVTGESTLSNSVDVYGPASLRNDLLVMGTSTLSNTLTVDGATIIDNSLFVTGASTLSNSLTVSGAATVDNSLLVIGASTLSNTLTVDGATVLDNSLFVTGASTFSNTMAVTSSASFLSNVTILGELSVDSVTYNLSNIVIYSSEEIRSNLLVEGILDVNSNLMVEGTSTLSNELHLFSSATLYNGESTVTLSNLGGSATLSASSNNFGINMFPTSNAEYTVDINGDINFSGQIYQNGAVFSGWNSNQWGNYINSNTAFSGPSTATDALLVYQSNNLAFSLSNTSGLVSMYTSNKFVGMGTSNPSHELDVVGSVRATDGVYVNSNESFFRGVRSDCVAGVAGASVFRGDVWASSTTYTTGTGILNKVQLLGSGAFVDNFAVAKSIPGLSNRNLPLAWNELITCAGGDVVAKNLFTTGSSMVDGSLSVIGSLTGNSAVLKSVVISGGHSNFHTDAGSISSNTTTVLSGTLPMASSNVALGSVLFEVNGDTALNSSLALRSNAFVGGALFVGSNMNSNAPSLPNALAPEFSNVHLDVQGDVVIEDGLFVRRTAAFDGRVGVGIHEPGYPVDVQSSVDGVSMNCSAKVIASEFVVFSDRPKTGIEAYVADDLIERLSVKRFEYVDTVEHPGSMVGFIAQEVESVAPDCVSTTSAFVTDIYSALPIVSREDMEYVVSISDVSLSSETNARIVDDAVLKCRSPGGEIFFVTVLRREGDLVTVLSSIAMPGIEDEDVLFVLGTRVDDFKMVRSDQINAISVATLQSQNKRIGALEAERMLGARYRETFEESSSNNQKYLSVVHTQPSHRVFIDDIEESITTDVMSVLAPLDAYGLTVVRGSKGPDALRKLEKERGYTHVTYSRLIVADALSASISLPTGSLLVVTLFDSYSVLLLFAGPSMSSASSSSTLRGIAAEKGSSSLVVHCVGQVSAGAVSILEKLMQRQNNTKPVVPAMTLITAPRNIDPTLTADTSSKLHKYDVLAVWGSPEFIRVTVNAMGSNTSAGVRCLQYTDVDDTADLMAVSPSVLPSDVDVKNILPDACIGVEPSTRVMAVFKSYTSILTPPSISTTASESASTSASGSASTSASESASTSASGSASTSTSASGSASTSASGSASTSASVPISPAVKDALAHANEKLMGGSVSQEKTTETFDVVKVVVV